MAKFIYYNIWLFSVFQVEQICDTSYLMIKVNSFDDFTKLTILLNRLHVLLLNYSHMADVNMDETDSWWAK